MLRTFTVRLKASTGAKLQLRGEVFSLATLFRSNSAVQLLLQYKTKMVVSLSLIIVIYNKLTQYEATVFISQLKAEYFFMSE